MDQLITPLVFNVKNAQARSVVRWISRLLEANQVTNVIMVLPCRPLNMYKKFLLILCFQPGLATQSLRDQRRAMRLHLDQVLHLVQFLTDTDQEGQEHSNQDFNSGIARA